MPSRFRRWAWGSLILASAAIGCALPDYHLPRGYSGTYSRALEGGGTGPVVQGSITEPSLPRSYVPVPPSPGID